MKSKSQLTIVVKINKCLLILNLFQVRCWKNKYSSIFLDYIDCLKKHEEEVSMSQVKSNKYTFYHHHFLSSQTKALW